MSFRSTLAVLLLATCGKTVRVSRNAGDARTHAPVALAGECVQHKAALAPP